MIKNFAKYIQNLPTLPEIIIDLDSFRKSKIEILNNLL